MEEALTSLLASVAGGRRYWGRAPQIAERPFIVMQRVDGVRDYHTQGASGYVASRVQVDVYGTTYTSTKQTVRMALALLSGYRSGSIQAVFVDNERDLPAADAGDVTQLFRTSVDIIVHHSES